MSKRRKSGNQDDRLVKVIILVTAITNLIATVIDLVNTLT